MIFSPPKVDERDDVTGEPLIQRVGDREEVVRRRLKIYRAQTRQMLDHYARQVDRTSRLIHVDGKGGPEEALCRLLSALSLRAASLPRALTSMSGP